jgi:hypothetical protein
MLTADDAGVVEAAFRDRMQVLELESHIPTSMPSPQDPPAPSAEPTPQPDMTGTENPATSGDTSTAALDLQIGRNRRRTRASSDPKAPRIDKSSLALMEPRRYRDKDHLRFIAAQPCTVCGRQPCEPHHLRFAQARALGRKVSDEFTVPPCRVHHREVHSKDDERGWWTVANIDPMPIALGFWQHTRGVRPSASDDGKSVDPKIYTTRGY